MPAEFVKVCGASATGNGYIMMAYNSQYIGCRPGGLPVQ